MNNHYIWVNRVKLIACFLVLLGHFLSGLILSNIIVDNIFLQWFSKTIYYFHVPLFFICSGYLYQQRSKVNDLKSWKNNTVKKFISLGVPYFTFSIITIIMKMVAASDVNNQAPAFLDTLFLNPIAPFWYLYVLFFIFLVIKTFDTKKETKRYFIISFLLKIIACIISNTEIYPYIPYFLRGIMGNECWFVMGMCMAPIEKLIRQTSKYLKEYVILFIIAIICSCLIIKYNLNLEIIDFLMGLMFCISIVGISICSSNIKEGRLEKFLSKYTMEIFLMHTICAACIRIVLIKVGITNAAIHLILGFIFSVFIPILISKIMEKTRILKFFIYPNTVLKEKGLLNGK